MVIAYYKDGRRWVYSDTSDTDCYRLTGQAKLSLVTNEDYAPTEDFNIFKENGNISKEDKKSEDNKTIDDEPPKKKQKLLTIERDGLIFVFFREEGTRTCKAHNTPLKPNKEIASISTVEVPIVINCEKSVESAEHFSAKNVNSTVRIIDPSIMINAEDRYSKFLNVSELSKKKLSSCSAKVNVVKQPLNEKNHIKRNSVVIEKLHKKYFSKFVQDSIVTIANILNIISMARKHYKARMAESLEKRSEGEILNANHTTILETKLKDNFSALVSSFEGPDFDTVFKMLFLSILTVLRVLDQPKFRKGNIFNKVLLFLQNSLKKSKYNHPKIFSMFRSKTFHPDCIDLIRIIEDSRDTDPGVIDRMPLYFIATSESQIYFQAVIDAVTSDSNEDLALLIDNATFKCHNGLKFKDNVVSSTVVHSNEILPITETILSPINSDNTIQHWFPENNPDRTCRKISALNGNKSQTIGNTAIEQSIKNFDESFSSSTQKKNSESFSSKVIPTEKCMTVMPSISNSSLMQITALWSEAEASTSGQTRAVVNGTNIFVESPEPTRFIKCCRKNCKSSATKICGVCKTVKYCSKDCQKLDWYGNHENDCEKLLNIKNSQS
ncbi:uncharacterized protein LOC111041828 [Myzus persicae]|uniref:uncharacterized protein LOC111041828 n=1 Tax=Myzus persicae TaxID=13164 RepID=UPI000B938634|nr:uncharacterized protein LOC111041828 [Myzus persicae]